MCTAAVTHRRSDSGRVDIDCWELGRDFRRAKKAKRPKTGLGVAAFAALLGLRTRRVPDGLMAAPSKL